MVMLRAILLVLFSFVFLVPASAEGQRVLLILDASGSMRGKIEGMMKIDIAKDVVAKVVANWKPEDELGLIAYGHRKKGACDDIEVLKQPGPLDKDAFMKAVNGLSPKGKTPMTTAVKMAAEALQYTEKKATVILVSDGIETCDQDPCSVAKALEEASVGLTVHTVGFGLDDQGAVAQLKCLADNTGGISIIADNADQLQDALDKTVAATEAPPPEPKAPEFNFTGHVSMAPGVELPKEFTSAEWTLHKLVDGAAGEWVQTEIGADIKATIKEPGDYLLTLKSGAAVVEMPVKAEAGKVLDLKLDLNAGIIHAIGMLDDKTPATGSSVAFELRADPDKFLDTQYGGDLRFLVNAGSYKLLLSLGDAKAEQAVSVEAGKTMDAIVSLGAGIVDVNTAFTPGGPSVLNGAAIEVRKGEVNADGGRDWINTQYGPKVSFKLRGGKYLLIGTQDYATGQAEVEVKSGETVTVNLSVDGGFLAVTAAGADSIEVYGGKDISGNRKWVATEYTAELNKAFNAGSWHVIAKKSDGTVIGEKDFEVKAGERAEGAIP